MKRKVADIILKYLESEGVEYVFLVPGTSIVPLFEESNKPTVIDCTIDPDEVPPLAPSAESLKSFSDRLDMI